MMRAPWLAIAALVLSAAPAFSQACTNDDVVCNQMSAGALILQARGGIALSGGNPVPGATSTLGMRIRGVPRITVAARVTGVGLDMPAITTRDGMATLPTSGRDFQSLAYSANIDAAIGVFGGLALAPTIGGFGSIDAIATVGTLRLPGSHGLTSDPFSYGVGLRIGVLRESFTAPGISASAVYRRIGEMKGESDLTVGGAPPGFTLDNNSVLSLRGVIGKRLFVVGANAGVGYDWYRSDVSAYGVDYRPVDGGLETYVKDGRKLGRFTAFVNATWTTLILNFVAEAGLQQGGDAFTGTLPQGQSSKTQKRGYYGSLAIRLAL